MPPKINQEKLELIVPEQIEEYNRDLGRDANYLPHWDELDAATSWSPQGLNKAVKRSFGEEYSILDFLRDRGFNREGTWPIDHNKSIKNLNDYVGIQLPKRENKPDSTISTRKSHLQKVVDEVVRIAGTEDLIELARFDTKEEKIAINEVFFAVYDRLLEEMPRNTLREYTRTMRQFYDYLAKHEPIDYNPAATAREDYWFPSGSKGDPVAPEDHQILEYWRAAETFEEREYLLKILIILHLVLGPRPSDILSDEFDAREHVQFDPEPIVIYEERKNNDKTDLPDEVPILGFVDLIEQHIKRLETGDVPVANAVGEDWDGSLLPAIKGNGSMSDDTIRNWFQDLEEVANTNFGEDGEDYIGPKNFRSWWFSKYRQALRELRPFRRLVASDQGNENLRISEDAYVVNEEMRADIRQQVRGEFEEVIPDAELELPGIEIERDDQATTLTGAVERHAEQSNDNTVDAWTILSGVIVNRFNKLSDLLRYRHQTIEFVREARTLTPLNSARRREAIEYGSIVVIMILLHQIATTWPEGGIGLVGHGLLLLMVWSFHQDIVTIEAVDGSQTVT